MTVKKSGKVTCAAHTNLYFIHSEFQCLQKKMFCTLRACHTMCNQHCTQPLVWWACLCPCC